MPAARNRRNARPGRGNKAANDATPKGKRAYLYARVSSRGQEREGFSIPAQQALLRSYAADNAFAIVEEFVDVETAKKTGRTSFTKMLAALRKEA
jgi:DNA invertase Pin-like site-specific DNA recombinase